MLCLMNADERTALGARVKKARIAARMGKEDAARRAGISAITWKRVEDGFPVHDVSLAAALGVLEPDTQPPVAPADVRTASDDDLLAELTYRLKRYAPVDAIEATAETVTELEPAAGPRLPPAPRRRA